MSEQSPDGTMADPAAPEQTAPEQTAPEQVRFDHVSEELKVGFIALGSPLLADADKPRWHQRLIAITNSAKHDLATAERRLVTFWTDWEAEVGPRPR